MTTTIMNRLAETHSLQTTDAEEACDQGLVSTFKVTLERVKPPISERDPGTITNRAHDRRF
jgi:hypothetical protein